MEPTEKLTFENSEQSSSNRFAFFYGSAPLMWSGPDLTKNDRKRALNNKPFKYKSFLHSSQFPLLLPREPSLNKPKPFDYFHKVLGSPKFILAPMVHQSELAFRMQVRKHGVQLAWTPMLNTSIFVESPLYRMRYFSTCPEDRPLVVQFAGNNPQELLECARMVEPYCDAIDLNFGCPQGIARRGNYGAFLMEKPEVVRPLVQILHQNLSIPVFCKMRVFDDYEKTLSFAKMLQEAGCSLLTVHGRTKEQKGEFMGLANWDYIRKLKNDLDIPVISNGNIRSKQDVEDCLKSTGADGVMSAIGLLNNPSIFSTHPQNQWDDILELLEFSQKYNNERAMVQKHICNILRPQIKIYTDWPGDLFRSHTFEEIRSTVLKFKQDIENNSRPLPQKRKSKNDSESLKFMKMEIAG